MRTAIPKLERRIKELEDFDPTSIQRRYDPRLEALENKLTDTISDVFGHGTIEYHRFAPSSLDCAGINMMYDTPLHEVIHSVTESKAREISMAILAIWGFAVVVGTNRKRESVPVQQSIQKYDRRDPRSPMQGVYSDSNCTVEEQTKGIYKCP